VILFITTAVKTSNPTRHYLYSLDFRLSHGDYEEFYRLGQHVLLYQFIDVSEELLA
jgi:hypothetical protein